MRIRRLAAAILGFAIRHSASESQDWGKAMRREMDFVENDWAALRWALGSVSAILRGMNAPVANLAPLLRRAQSFENWMHCCNMVSGALHSLECAVFGSCEGDAERSTVGSRLQDFCGELRLDSRHSRKGNWRTSLQTGHPIQFDSDGGVGGLLGLQDSQKSLSVVGRYEKISP